MKRFGEGLSIIINSISIFLSWPKLIVPLLLSWLVYAPSAIYFEYYYPWGQYSTPQNILVAFGIIVSLSITLCFSCSWLLEMLQDIEARKSVGLLDTFKRVFFENFKAILPVAIVWAFLWFLLSVISAILGKEDKDSDEELTAQSAAETLAGHESFSFTKAFIDALKKGIRMIVFLIMPAIAWEFRGLRRNQKGSCSIPCTPKTILYWLRIDLCCQCLGFSSGGSDVFSGIKRQAW